MKFPQIRMESQFAQIGIRQTLGTQNIRQPKAELSIEQPKATITIETIPSMLTIDQTEAWEQMNLISPIRFSEKNAQEGLNSVQEGTARRAEQGNEMMRIEHGGNPLVSQALTNGHRQMKTLGIKFIPEPFSVKYDYKPSQIQIDAAINKPIIDVQTNKPVHTYERGSLEVYIEQYEDLQIEFEHLYSASI